MTTIRGLEIRVDILLESKTRVTAERANHFADSRGGERLEVLRLPELKDRVRHIPDPRLLHTGGVHARDNERKLSIEFLMA